MWKVEGVGGGVRGGSWGVAAVAVVAAGLLGWLLVRRGRSSTKARLPPGSRGWPVFGETLEFLGNCRQNKWSLFYEQHVAKYGEPFRSHLFFSTSVLMPAPEGNKYLFQNENKTVVAGAASFPPAITTLLGPQSLSTSHGEAHRRLRRLYGSFFSPEGLRRFVPQMSKIAKDHLKQHWDGKEEVELGVVAKQFAFEVACYLFVGVEAGPELDGMSKAFATFNAGFFSLPLRIPGSSFYKALKERKYLDRVCDTILARRRQEMMQSEGPRATRDLLDVLLTVPDEDGSFMNDDGIKDNLVNLLFAGHDTSAHTLGMVGRMLHHHPQCLEGVVKEQLAVGKGGLDDDEPLTWEELRSMKYTWAVIQETLRIEPTVLGGWRDALEDIEFAGYTIPKGTKMLFTASASHRNEKFFPEPDKFDPSRFENSAPQPYTYVPFGGGPRLCLGFEFARAEMLIFVHYVVLNYEFEMVEPDEKIIRAPTFPKLEKGCRIRLRKRQVA